MATQLDLQEQEQLEDIKHFWKQYGNLITWTLVLALGGFAAWQGWNWWQREQSLKASAMYDELERVADAGDAARAAQVFAELKERYPRTAFAEQGGLLAAKVQFDKGQADNARAALGWVAEHAIEGEYKTVARLRLAGLLLDAKQYDEALKQLDAAKDDKAFEGLVADRRGDVLLAQGKKDDARAAYQAAYKALEPTVDYRRLVEAKLTALGAAPEAAAAASAASAGVKK
ncbi:MAG TPA: tetratricopeptide repeat protein [Burkholderiaceae bacterium]|jgi:predicted negative regulator of RcsB-dependent stress response|nr:tetratricopeptide repeat protein [Burkholderiaceae bacterium]